MKISRFVISFALAAAAMLPAAGTLSAADRWGDYRDRDIRSDYRDLSHDYRSVDYLRQQVARDEWQLNEDIRCGRRWAVERDRRQLELHRRMLSAQWRNIRNDHEDIRRDYYRGR